MDISYIAVLQVDWKDNQFTSERKQPLLHSKKQKDHGTRGLAVPLYLQEVNHIIRSISCMAQSPGTRNWKILSNQGSTSAHGNYGLSHNCSTPLDCGFTGSFVSKVFFPWPGCFQPQFTQSDRNI